MKRNTKLYRVDDHMEYDHLFFFFKNVPHDFHAGDQYIEWGRFERIVEVCNDEDFTIYQGDPYGKYCKFGVANLSQNKFELVEDDKTNTKKPENTKWDHATTCSRYFIRKLSKDRFMILYND